MNIIDKIVTEEHGSGLYPAANINECQKMAQGMVNGFIPNIFKKVTQTYGYRGRKVFKEGWMVSIEPSNFYTTFGQSKEAKRPGDYMPTLESISGEPKIKTDLTVETWATSHMFYLMFGKNNFYEKGGKVWAKDNELLKANADRWDRLLTSFTGMPMYFVLQQYFSHYEIELIVNTTYGELNQMITQLRNFGDDLKGDITDTTNFPLLAKGLFGNAKAIKNRRNMRIKFWEVFNLNRTDLFDFSRQFSAV
jgi:hypothetical protein